MVQKQVQAVEGSEVVLPALVLRHQHQGCLEIPIPQALVLAVYLVEAVQDLGEQIRTPQDSVSVNCSPIYVTVTAVH